MRDRVPLSIHRLTCMGLLVAAGLVLYAVEMRLPGPSSLPGVRLGLANIITVYAAFTLSFREASMVILSRIFLSAFIGGGPMAFCYSLAGGMSCFVGMLVMKEVSHRAPLWLAGMVGTLLHSAGQVAVAMVFSGTAGMAAYFPLLAVSGGVSGIVTGLSAEYLISRSTAAGYMW